MGDKTDLVWEVMATSATPLDRIGNQDEVGLEAGVVAVSGEASAATSEAGTEVEVGGNSRRPLGITIMESYGAVARNTPDFPILHCAQLLCTYHTHAAQASLDTVVPSNYASVTCSSMFRQPRKLAAGLRSASKPALKTVTAQTCSPPSVQGGQNARNANASTPPVPDCFDETGDDRCRACLGCLSHRKGSGWSAHATVGRSLGE